MNTLLSIGMQIREARKAAGLTSTTLAELCSISRGTLVRLESGQGNVQLNTLLAICGNLKLAIQLIPDQVATMPSSEQTNASPLARRLAARLQRQRLSDTKDNE